MGVTWNGGAHTLLIMVRVASNGRNQHNRYASTTARLRFPKFRSNWLRRPKIGAPNLGAMWIHANVMHLTLQIPRPLPILREQCFTVTQFADPKILSQPQMRPTK